MDKNIGNEKNILFYNDEERNTQDEVLLENQDVWLNVDALTKLFYIDRSGIVRHINNIYKDEELSKNVWVMMENKPTIQSIMILI